MLGEIKQNRAKKKKKKIPVFPLISKVWIIYKGPLVSMIQCIWETVGHRKASGAF